MEESEAALAVSLRTEILERVKMKHQILSLAAVVAAASASFGAEKLSDRSEVLALLSLLFVGFWLAMLRQDQDIIIAARFLAGDHLGDSSQMQARWEKFRMSQLQSGLQKRVIAAATTAGLYGIPFLGSIAYGVAALKVPHDCLTVVILVFAGLLFVLACVTSKVTVGAYQFAKEG